MKLLFWKKDLFQTKRSSGFGLALVAETTTGMSLSCEGVGTAGMVPEDLGSRVANLLLSEISNVSFPSVTKLSLFVF